MPFLVFRSVWIEIVALVQFGFVPFTPSTKRTPMAGRAIYQLPPTGLEPGGSDLKSGGCRGYMGSP